MLLSERIARHSTLDIRPGLFSKSLRRADTHSVQFQESEKSLRPLQVDCVGDSLDSTLPGTNMLQARPSNGVLYHPSKVPLFPVLSNMFLNC